MIKILSENLNELCSLVNVINPNIHEEINGAFTFSFSTILDENTQYVQPPNIAEVDNDYFYIARVRRSHTVRGVAIDVECEHISYLMNNYENDEEYDMRTPDYIVARLMGFTPQFGLYDIDFWEPVYFNPGKKTVRECLFELANFLGGELVFKKFNVSLVNKRGTDNGLELKIGENIIGITEEIDNRNDTRASYEVDALDLSHLEGYEFLPQLEIGDTVRVLNESLNIDSNLRAVSYDRNPFKKVMVHLQIGSVVRNYTNYIKDSIDEVSKKVDDVVPDPEPIEYLTEFRIGNINCLALPDVDITELVRENMKNGTPYDVTTIVNYSTLDSLSGLFVKLKNQTYNLKIEEITKEGAITTYSKSDLTTLGTTLFPNTDNSIIKIYVSYHEWVNTQYDGDFKVYAIKFSNDVDHSGDMYKFEFGKSPWSGSEINFEFINVYDDILSVTIGTIGTVTDHLTFTSTLVKNAENKCTGMKVKAVGAVPTGVQVTAQVVGYIAPTVGGGV